MHRRMGRRVVPWVVAAVALVSVTVPARSAGEDELLVKIKNDVFEQRWDGVLAQCDEFIRSFPSSPSLPRAYYYRAQGLEHIKGREADAIAAYGDFLKKFPKGPGTLTETATLSRITLATSLAQKGDKGQVGVLMEGMNLKGYPGVYAAIQSSKIDHAAARQKAMPLLRDCASEEPDDEVRNECVVALLRIKPESLEGIHPPVPPVPPAKGVRGLPPVPEKPGKPPAPPGPGDAKLIRVEIVNKVTGKVTVRVNMPLAFADLVLQSIGDNYSEILNKELQEKGVGVGLKFDSLHQLMDAIKKGGKQTLVEIDQEGESIKVWIE